MVDRIDIFKETWPSSIREINALPEPDKHSIYRTLIPDWLYETFDIELETGVARGYPVVRFHCPQGSRAMEVSVRRDAQDRDPVLYLNMADTFNQQLLVLLVVVNDPDAPRFNVDMDQFGNSTNFGTSSRNIPAELAAMRGGLAPGQIRRGLRAFKQSVPIFETFVSKMQHDMFLIEPLAYHNAIVFERYGFNYIKGLQDMHEIHAGFLEGGILRRTLTHDNPFRQPDAGATVRGRSWAIHDGILGHPFTGFHMYKRISKHAGINTFPNFSW